MKTVVVVRDVATLGAATADSLARCFGQRGWRVRVTTERIKDEPDLVAGWGFRDVIHEAWDRWPERVLHVDAGFWGRHNFHKLALGGRWSRLIIDRDFDDSRLRAQRVKVEPNRRPGKLILVCGMSEKAAVSWGMEPESWERSAIKRLKAWGASVIYRPKPTWTGATRLKGAAFDRTYPINQTLNVVRGVVSHHSNAAVDALAAGLPIYVEVGIAKSLSVANLRDIVGAEAPDWETRNRFLRQVAWHQWTLDELARGVWLKPPAPLAGLLS